MSQRTMSQHTTSQRARSSESASEPMPLYPDERRIALAVMGRKRASQWPEKVVALERRGLPKVDAMMGGRYWPAVRRFFDVYSGLDDAPQKDVPQKHGPKKDAPLAEIADLRKAAARAHRTRRRALAIVQQDRRASRS